MLRNKNDKKYIYMGHISSKSYYKLQNRLEANAQGAPASGSLFKILETIFTKKEAELVSILPMKFFTEEQAAQIWKMDKMEASTILNELANKGILFDFRNGDIQGYFLAPPIPGFFEFTLMRTDGKFDRKILSKLFHEYLYNEDALMKQVGANYPSVARVFPTKEVIKDQAEVLPYEEARKVIETASRISVGTCYCRHKQEHMGHKCKYPQETCLTLNKMADNLIKHGIAKEISKKEALDILDKCLSLGLVQIGDNVQKQIFWLCNCCACCCGLIRGYKKFGYSDRHKSRFIIKDQDKCIGCGVCSQKCPVDALRVDQDKKIVVIDQHKCVGCGVCARFCPQKNLLLIKRKNTNKVPIDMFEKMVLEALHAGKLQNYLFDNYASMSNVVLRKFIGIILSLGPRQLIRANEQLQSTFVRAATKTKKYKFFNKLFNE